ncbi:DUF4238 domain-containing protein [Pelosinus fermentans]|uniref:DUF4238 domain-containing protein n=1 Tax=Pelosinus fermentans JBW45 TaxID=1192197 RepID=I8TUP1_9FIRM|nr:DUF4238 domain-containing protein [Pelosinus fermentans]AJQ26940.1 Protein of unknown function DUF4238 [Pelosinus fermentans JBW45]
MGEKNNERQKQHFVPKGYLNNFSISRKGTLWQYDKKEQKLSPKKPVSSKSVCQHEYYYYQHDEEGNIDHITIEKETEKVDTKGLNIINRMLSVPQNQSIEITAERQDILAFFLAFLLTRNPCVRDGINQSYGTAAEILSKILQDQGKYPPLPEGLSPDIMEKIRLEIFAEVSLRPMVIMAEQIALSMMKKCWFLLRAQANSYYVTSDNPVSFDFPYSSYGMNMGPSHPLSEISIPLGERLAIIITPFPKQGFSCKISTLVASRELNQLINWRTIRSAARYVYSPYQSNQLLSSIKKAHGMGQKVVCNLPETRRIKILDHPYLNLK